MVRLLFSKKLETAETLMRALDAGPLDELKKKYGDCSTAAGFTYHAGMEPSVVMKVKKNQEPVSSGDVFPES